MMRDRVVQAYEAAKKRRREEHTANGVQMGQKNKKQRLEF